FRVRGALVALVGQRDQPGGLQLGQDSPDPLGLLVVHRAGQLSWSIASLTRGFSGLSSYTPRSDQAAADRLSQDGKRSDSPQSFHIFFTPSAHDAVVIMRSVSCWLEGGFGGDTGSHGQSCCDRA